jgi:hypothetical protein
LAVQAMKPFPRPEEILAHLEETFAHAVDQRPDLMEPYLIRLGGTTEGERKVIMREGLRETFKLRYPSKLTKRDQAAEA